MARPRAKSKSAPRSQKKRAGAMSSLLCWLPLATSLMVVVACGGLVAAGYHYLSQPGRLPLRVVDVTGAFRHLNPAEISATASATIDGGFFTCDIQKLRAAVLAMPWVADVSVRRVWPDRLHMRVSEQVPLARWGDDALVSASATVFSPRNAAEYAELIKLAGPEGSAHRVVAFYRAALPAAHRRDLQIREVELDERRHWWLRFDGGLTLSLGREQRDERLAQFLRVYPRLIADSSKRPVRVDMRYAHGFAVRWEALVVDETETAGTALQSREEV